MDHGGIADWVAAKVIDAMGWQSYALTIRQAKRQFSRNSEIVPELTLLQNSHDWQVFLQKPRGYMRTYNVAFVAVDRVMEKNGVRKVLDHVRSGDWGYIGTQAQMNQKIDSKTSSETENSSQLKKVLMAKPDWKVGYTWIYEEKLSGKKTQLLTQVLGEDSIRGIPVFVVRFGDDKDLYTKETLALVATMKTANSAQTDTEPANFSPGRYR
jgi:hypothetical protein